MPPLDQSTSDGLGMAPRAIEPQSAMIPGMAAPAPPPAAQGPSEPVQRFGQFGHLQLGSMPNTSGPGPVATQQPSAWTYDFNPATGNSRASYDGEVDLTGGPGGLTVDSLTVDGNDQPGQGSITVELPTVPINDFNLGYQSVVKGSGATVSNLNSWYDGGWHTDLELHSYTTKPYGVGLDLKMRRGTDAAPLPVIDGDNISWIDSFGWTGTLESINAEIATFVDGAVGAGVPGRLQININDGTSQFGMTTLADFRSDMSVTLGKNGPFKIDGPGVTHVTTLAVGSGGASGLGGSTWQVIGKVVLAAPAPSITIDGLSGYRAVKIIGQLIPAATGNNIIMQTRKGGVTNAGANYELTVAYVYNAIGATAAAASSAGQTSWTLASAVTVDGNPRNGLAIDLTFPNIALAGYCKGIGMAMYDGANVNTTDNFGLRYVNAAQTPIDGFIWSMSAGNFATGSSVLIMGLT